MAFCTGFDSMHGVHLMKKVASEAHRGINQACQRTKQVPPALGRWVTAHWLLYSSIRTVFIVTTIPVSAFGGDLGLRGSAIMAAFFLPLFFLLDTRKTTVANRDPLGFINSERLERLVDVLSWAFLVSIYAFFVLVLVVDRVGYGYLIQYLVSAFLVIVYFGFGLVVAFFFNGIERAISVNISPSRAAKYRYLKLLSNCFVPLRSSARARMRVVLSVLYIDRKIRTTRRRTSLFNEGLDIYNEHLKVKYDFVIRDPYRFYKYVRLTSLSSDPRSLIRLRDYVIQLVRQFEKKEDPYELLRTLIFMTEKSENKTSDLYKDIEIEPMQFKKRVKAHAELLKYVITIALTVIGSIILPLVLEMYRTLKP